MSHNTETSWSRRGHSRKPNLIVCGIYWVADWLGDFKHLASTTRRGAGHVSAFAGYSLLLIVTLAITIFIVITSAVHSLKLLHWIGFNDWTAYLTLFVVEAIFLIGSIQIDLALKHGLPLWSKKYMPTPPVFGFAAGLAFVLSSNVMGLASNYGGLAFGIATPFLLIISKAMLAWQYTFKGKTPENQAVPTSEKVENSPIETPEKSVEKSTEFEERKRGENFEGNAEEKSTKNAGDEIPTSPVVASDSEDKKLEKSAQKNSEKTSEKIAEKIPTVTGEKSNENTSKKTVNKTKQKPAKRRKSTKKNPEKMVDKAVEIIKEKLAETGDFPSHNDVAVLAKTTVHYAKKARTIVEEEPDKKTEKRVEEQPISQAS